MAQPPRILLDTAAKQAAAEDVLRRAGWTIRRGWSGGRGEVRSGVVSDVEDAGALLRWVLDGGGVVALVAAPALRAALHDDLRHLGGVHTWEDACRRPGVLVHHEGAALLELIAQGLSVGESARRAHVSLRTAERRLAAARRVLGAASTEEAVTLLCSAASGQAAETGLTRAPRVRGAGWP